MASVTLCGSVCVTVFFYVHTLDERQGNLSYLYQSWYTCTLWQDLTMHKACD